MVPGPSASDLSRLRAGSFVPGGVHLRPDHYHTIRCDVEEQAALHSYPVQPHPYAGAQVSYSAPAPPHDPYHQTATSDAGRNDDGAANQRGKTAGGHDAIREI